MKSSPITCLTQTLMDSIAAEARASSRKRKNYNFHELDDRVQRFLNVLQPGTYVRPHRHLRDADANGFEFFLVLQGAIGMLIFDEQGTIIQTQYLSATGETKGIEVAQGTFHTLIALAPDSVMFELKEGPYIPITDKDFLAQFPQEGTPEAAECIRAWEAHFSDQKIPQRAAKG
jgi:cupin fold WbuC family metalloprotein